MKKIMLTLCLVLFVSSAYAGSCPMLAKNIDEKIKKAQELKDQGMDAHKAGDLSLIHISEPTRPR